ETATGKYPVESVLMMRQIGEITEQEFPYDNFHDLRQKQASQTESVTEAISSASCDVAEAIDAKAIVSTTMSGYTARQISRHRPPITILAVTPSPVTRRRLALIWGVNCLLVEDFSTTDEMLEQTVDGLRSFGLERNDKLVITAGIPFGASGQTNWIQVHEMT
ncbi:MAG: pyruvate kinase, partial [Chloroflexi bacterium]